MPEYTPARLTRAQHDLAALEGEVERLKRAALSALADTMPPNLDRLAEHTAMAQRDVTRRLGSDGLTELRIDLRDAANDLGDELTGSAPDIPWPGADGRYSPIRQEEIHGALHRHLEGHRIERLARIFQRHGFAAGTATGRQTLVTPRVLTERIDFSRLADGLTRLARAERERAGAQRSDDRATARELWSRSNWYRDG